MTSIFLNQLHLQFIAWGMSQTWPKKQRLTDWMFLTASSTKRTFWGATPDLASKAWFLIWIPHERDLHCMRRSPVRGVVFEPPNAAACIHLVDSTFQKAWMHQGRQGHEHVDLSVLVWSHVGAKASNVFKKFTSQTAHCAYITNLSSHYTEFNKSVTFEPSFPSMHHSNVKALEINAALNLRHPSLRCQVPLPWSSAKAKLCASANCLCFSQGDLN